MLETMYRLGVEQDRKFGLYAECKTQYKVKLSGLIVLSPIDFPDDQQNPTKGVWQTRYQLERCGDSKFYNALFIARNNGEPPTSRPTYPGSTHAGPVLVKDAMLSAITGALGKRTAHPRLLTKGSGVELRCAAATANRSGC